MMISRKTHLSIIILVIATLFLHTIVPKIEGKGIEEFGKDKEKSFDHYDHDDDSPVSSIDVLNDEIQDSYPLDESNRFIEYHKRNYTWPLDTYHPNTEGWKRIHERRFRQIERIDDLDARYEAWATIMGSAFVIPNFTESGYVYL